MSNYIITTPTTSRSSFFIHKIEKEKKICINRARLHRRTHTFVNVPMYFKKYLVLLNKVRASLNALKYIIVDSKSVSKIEMKNNLHQCYNVLIRRHIVFSCMLCAYILLMKL